MATKSNIRKKVESIVGKTCGIVYIDATSKKKLKYRMKLVGLAPFSESIVKQLSKLPNVVGTDYEHNAHYGGKRLRGFYSGPVVYFDCKPSLINI